MKTRIALVISILIPLTLMSFSTISSQSSDPERTIRDFSEALKSKDKKPLTKYLTNEPAAVYERALQEHLRIHALKTDISKQVDPGASYVRSGQRTYAPELLVDVIVPTDLFFSQNRTINEIASLRRHKDEALASVELAGFDPVTKVKFAPLKYDILLHRVNGEWKIFKLLQRYDGDEKYYEYNFYAKP